VSVVVLTHDQLTLIADVVKDLIKTGYMPFSVTDSTFHYVQTEKQIFNILKIVERKFSMIFKRAVGDNTTVSFDIENENLCVVSFDSNAINSPVFKYWRPL
jgi:hypothetical protein